MPRPKRPVPMDRYTVMTLAEVGRRLGVTPQAVYAVEKRALWKIGREMQRRGFVRSEAM